MNLKMKHIVFILFFAAISQISFAQISIGGGLAVGTEIENIGFSAKGAYQINDQWAGNAGFTLFLPKSNGGLDLTLWTVNFDGHYLFKLNDKFSAYPLAGLNISTFSTDVNLGIFGTEKVSNTKVGLNIGGGALLNISEKMNGFAELKYVIGDFDQLVLNVGVLYGIGK